DISGHPPRCFSRFRPSLAAIRLDALCRDGRTVAAVTRVLRMPARIIPVIMCGGTGTRLWPVSRGGMPKQFVSIVRSTWPFQGALGRVNDPELFGRPIVITNADFRFVVAEQLREAGIEADIVLEPVRRDSGLAVAISAVLAAERNRNGLVLVLAADHVVRKP